MFFKVNKDDPKEKRPGAKDHLRLRQRDIRYFKPQDYKRKQNNYKTTTKDNKKAKDKKK